VYTRRGVYQEVPKGVPRGVYQEVPKGVPKGVPRVVYILGWVWRDTSLYASRVGMVGIHPSYMSPYCTSLGTPASTPVTTSDTGYAGPSTVYRDEALGSIS